ncbi:MAG: helix-turn-helix domain-containing protein [Egibacteraceae bacterium]
MARNGVLRQAVQVHAAADEARSARSVAEAIADEPIEGVVLVFPGGRTVALPASLVSVVRASAEELASGHSVTVLPTDAVLTPVEAAEVLGLSPRFVIRLLDAGDIPSQRSPLSGHRRIRLTDVLAFAERRDRRREGRRQIGQAVADAGLPY